MGQQKINFFRNTGSVTVNTFNGDPDNPNEKRINGISIRAKDGFVAMVESHQQEWQCTQSDAVVRLALLGHKYLKIRNMTMADVEKMEQVFRKLTPSALNDLLRD